MSGPAGVAPLSGLLEELTWRGMLDSVTPGLAARLASGRSINGYNGFDPSGPSLHIGNLVPIFGLIHLQRHGGRPVALIGGATGMIGDPSGRAAGERQLLDRPELEANGAAIRSQLEPFLDFSSGTAGALLVNNLEWLGEVTMLEFLRDVGKHFTIPYMLAKDSVQQRLERGLSFTEFSYMLLQAADFLHLHQTFGVELQMGGADQWGNITAGLELIRRHHGAEPDGEDRAHGLAYRLLLSPSGQKFGKSEAGESIWLDASRTSPYAFYQHWLNADDLDVGVFLRWFTLLSKAQIAELEASQVALPEGRPAQRAMAFDITARVHGPAIATQVVQLSEAVFGGRLAALDPDLQSFAATQLPRITLSPEAIGMTVLQFALASGAYPSSSEARRGIAQGGFYINDVRQTDPHAIVPAPLGGSMWTIRTGRKGYRLAVLAFGADRNAGDHLERLP